MSGIPVEDPPRHKCINCEEPLHGGPCGHLITELPTHIIIHPTAFSENARKLLTSPNALLCNYCADTLNGAKQKSPPIANPPANNTPSTNVSSSPPRKKAKHGFKKDKRIKTKVSMARPRNKAEREAVRANPELRACGSI
jgi:hypothetical protein